MLEAKAQSCFHPTFVLRKDGRPLGQFRYKWFSEGLVIQLLGRRNLQLRRESLLGRRFLLIDSASGEPLASAERKSWWSLRWRLDLTCGAAELAPASWMSPRFKIIVNGRPSGIVHRRWCSFAWTVEPTCEMPVVDQLMVGLVFHIILRRRHRRNS